MFQQNKIKISIIQRRILGILDNLYDNHKAGTDKSNDIILRNNKMAQPIQSRPCFNIFNRYIFLTCKFICSSWQDLVIVFLKDPNCQDISAGGVHYQSITAIIFRYHTKICKNSSCRNIYVTWIFLHQNKLTFTCDALGVDGLVPESGQGGPAVVPQLGHDHLFPSPALANPSSSITTVGKLLHTIQTVNQDVGVRN